MSPFLSRAPKPALALCLGLLGGLCTARASAQSDEQRAGARAVATEGASAFKAGRYQDAVELFGKAESLVHAPPHLLFLARSHAKLGQFVKAREAYLKITKEPLAANAPVAFRDAQLAAADELKLVEPHIGSLVVTVSGGKDVRDLALTIDGQPVSSVLVGVAQPMDPGDHQVAARATGFRAASATVSIRDAERQSVNLTLVADPTSVPVVAPVAPSAAPVATTEASGPTNRAPAVTPEAASDASVPAHSPGSGLKTGAYVAFGVGAIGLGVGTLFAIKSKNKRSDADNAFATLDARCHSLCSADDPDAQNVASLDDSARSAKTVAVVGFALGGAGIATGVTLLLVGSHQNEAPAGASLEPWLGLGSGGIRGTF